MAGKARISWVLRACAFALLLVAIFFTAPAREGRSVWILLDVSGSVRRLYAEELQNLPAIAAPCLQTVGTQDRVGLLLFAGHPILEIEPCPRAEFASILRSISVASMQVPEPAESETNFESAALLARARSSSGDRPEFWFWTDGLQTRGDLAALRAGAGASESWFRLPFPPGPRWDAQVRSLRAPRECAAGSENTASVSLWGDSRAPSAGTLRFEIRGADFKPAPAELAWSLAAGERRDFSFPFSVPRSGEFALSASIHVQGQDPIRANDEKTIWIRSGEGRTLLSLGDPGALRQEFQKRGAVFLNPLTEPGAPRVGLPVEQFGAFDGLWVQGAGPSFDAKDDAQIVRLLQSGFVFVFLGNPNSYSSFFRELPRLRETLPWLPSPEEQKSGATVLLLDGSGSMAGGKFELAANAAWSLARAMPENEELRVGVFGETLGSLQLWKKRASKDPEPIAISAGPAGARGGTGIESSLRAALAAFSGEDSGQRRRIILLSDGRQTVPGPSPDRFAEIAQELKEREISVTALAFGDDPDLGALRALASQESNGRVIPVKSLDALAGIFEREGSSEYFEPGPHASRLAASSPFPDLPPNAPALASRMKVKLKPDAQRIYETVSGKPVLAMRREGLGMAICLAADPAREDDAGWMGEASIWESILLSIPRRQDEGEIVLDESGASYFPGAAKPQGAEIALSFGGGGRARFWKRGDSFRTSEISASEAVVPPFLLTQSDGAALPAPRLDNALLQADAEWRGGGRSILRQFADPPADSTARAQALSRRTLLLASLAALLLSWLLPAALSLIRSRKATIPTDTQSEARSAHLRSEA